MRSQFRFMFKKRVRFAEVDAQGVLYHGRYIEYFDIGLQEFWRTVGQRRRLDLARDGDFHVVKAEVIYRKAILPDEEIDICVRARRIGTTSITFALELHGHGAEDLRALGEIVHVQVESAQGRPTAVRPAYITLLETHEGRTLRSAETPPL